MNRKLESKVEGNCQQVRSRTCLCVKVVTLLNLRHQKVQVVEIIETKLRVKSCLDIDGHGDEEVIMS